MKRRNQDGVALVITLILLAIITIVVVAFLAVSQRNRSLLTTATDLTSAQFIADAGAERAQAEVAARFLAQPVLGPVPMLVSTNYTAWQGFDPTDNNYNPFNVSYTLNRLDDPANPLYDPANGAPLSYSDLMRNLQNLYFNPRAPVFVRTNPSPIYVPEFRFYLDLNRNGRFDATGNRLVLDEFNQPVIGPSGAIRVPQIGDPEWVGVLENPDAPHSSSNRFIGRYAYIVIPEGLTLDLNSMHNYAKFAGNAAAPAGADGFLRNMGVGTWEMNLGAFLVGLNTNFWFAPGQTGGLNDYQYNLGSGVPNTGFAFNDALSLLSYRYRSNRLDAASAGVRWLLGYQALYGSGPASYVATNRIDEYADGPLLTGENIPLVENPQDAPTVPWAGAPNPVQYASVDDVFDPLKVGVNFLSRLDAATLGAGTYNSGTYYRLLSQLGTDSGVEPESFVPGLGVDQFTATNPAVPYNPPDKINLNFDNRDQRALGLGANTAAQAIDWEPLAFFTNAAARMLRSQAFIGSDGRMINLTNIMVWPTNNYDGAVHRVLQVAANLYDATVSQRVPALPSQGTVHRLVWGDPYQRLHCRLSAPGHGGTDSGSGRVYPTGCLLGSERHECHRLDPRRSQPRCGAAHGPGGAHDRGR